VVDLFATMVFSSHTQEPDAVSKWFDLTKAHAEAKRRCEEAFDGIYEGVLDGQRGASGGGEVYV